MRTLVWFRGKDLRTSDHAPLAEAVARGEVLCLFVLDPYFFEPKRAQALPHRMQYLLESMRLLAEDLVARGSRLLVVKGRSVEVVPRLAEQWRVDRVVAHRWVEPFGRERDARIASALRVPFILYEGETLVPPGTLRNTSGLPYSVFTPFFRAHGQALQQSAGPGRPLPAPRTLPPVPAEVKARTVAIPSCRALGIAPNPNLPPAGEAAAKRRLTAFLKKGLARYHVDRDLLAVPGTSRLSADLKFGTISVRMVWHALAEGRLQTPGGQAFARQLAWREFAYHSLWDRPMLLEEPFQARFAGFPWRKDTRLWKAWIQGKTGYPVVDASARQLLTEGFVHNRARMLSASFLTKHLLIPYADGEAHYLRYLVDGDWAQNNLGWQWSAGTGCDAQPYFRVFHPVTQGRRYDPEGHYVRTWLPELAELPPYYLHAPWEAPEAVLGKAGVVLGRTYPRPVVDHRQAREEYLRAARRHLR